VLKVRETAVKPASCFSIVRRLELRIDEMKIAPMRVPIPK
jgi:hypothetical protein